MKHQFDRPLLFALVLLTSFSLFTILGVKKSLFPSQFIYFLVGFGFLFVCARLGINFFRVNARLFYTIAASLLVATFFFGETIRGSRRWLDFYFFNFQASEFLKVFFVIYLADFFARDRVYQKFSLADLKKILVSLLVFLPPMLLIFKQPDLGSAAIYFLVYWSVLFFSGLPMRYFAYLLFIFLLFTPLAWYLLADYQKGRLSSFINTDLDPSGISYNLIQSVITVGSGGFFGRGLGRGTQSRFLFLPENTTDFAYASLVEQFGLIGGLIVVLLYGFIVYRLAQKARRHRYHDYAFLFLTAVSVFLTTQVFVNIGMNLGLMPIAGIPLPLISYGGSATVSVLMLFGLAIAL